MMGSSRPSYCVAHMITWLHLIQLVSSEVHIL